VQYHPEARPGPWDNEYIFRDFVAALKGRGAGRGGGATAEAGGR